LEVLDAFLERLIEIAPGHIQKLDRFQSEATGPERKRPRASKAT
jgi:hypothetical protein